MFSAKFNTVVFWKNDYDDENFHHCFLILYYNKFPKVCGHTPRNYYSKWKFTTINSMSLFVGWGHTNDDMLFIIVNENLLQ